MMYKVVSLVCLASGASALKTQTYSKDTAEQSYLCGSVDTCTDTILNSVACAGNDCHPCGNRIRWVMDNIGRNELDSCQQVGEEFPDVCGQCAPEQPPTAPPTVPPTRPPTFPGQLSTRIMSYNTQFDRYPCCGPDHVPQFANHINSIQPHTVGLQESQDPQYLADQTGLYFIAPCDLAGRGRCDNAILYHPNRTTFLGQSGVSTMISDSYALRSFTWGQFEDENGNEFWHFNTHLPHNLGDAAPRDTHARIAQAVLAKIDELGATNVPVTVTCDCNPFASDSWNSFESNLNDAGFTTAYIGTGEFGGFGGLDKIFVRNYADVLSAQDHGPGGSDHPAITADIVF